MAAIVDYSAKTQNFSNFSTIICDEDTLKKMTEQEITRFVCEMLDNSNKGKTAYIAKDAFYRKATEIQDKELYNRMLKFLRDANFTFDGYKSQFFAHCITITTKTNVPHLFPEAYVEGKTEKFAEDISTLSEGAYQAFEMYQFCRTLPENFSQEVFVELIFCQLPMKHTFVRALLNCYLASNFSLTEEEYNQVCLLMSKLEMSYNDRISFGTKLSLKHYGNDDVGYIKCIKQKYLLFHPQTTSMIIEHLFREKNIQYKKIDDSSCFGLEIQSFLTLFAGEESEFKDLIIEFVDTIYCDELNEKTPSITVSERYKRMLTCFMWNSKTANDEYLSTNFPMFRRDLYTCSCHFSIPDSFDRSDLKQVVQAYPKTELAMDLANQLLQNKEYDAASSLLDRLLRRVPLVKRNSVNAMVGFFLYSHYIEGKNPDYMLSDSEDECICTWLAPRESEQKSYYEYLCWGILCFNRSFKISTVLNLALAETMLLAAHKKSPTTLSAKFLGAVYYQLHKDADARTYLLKADQADPFTKYYLNQVKKDESGSSLITEIKNLLNLN